MSYFTLKSELTGNDNTVEDLQLALDRTYIEIDNLSKLKQGIVNTIFIPAIDVISEYIIARQNYLNDTDITYTASNTNYPNVAAEEWRSPLTDEFTGSSDTTSLCTQPYFGRYEGFTGSLSAWRIEKWSL